MNSRRVALLLSLLLLISLAAASSPNPTEEYYNDGDYLMDYVTSLGYAYNFPNLEPIVNVLQSRIDGNAQPLEEQPTPTTFQQQHTTTPASYVTETFIPHTQQHYQYPSPAVATHQPYVYPPGATPILTETANWVINTHTAGDRVVPDNMLQYQPQWPQAYPYNQLDLPAFETLQLPPTPLPPAPSQYMCDFDNCPFTADTPGHVRQHQRYHAPEAQRPHACPIPGCPRRFVAPREVGRHLGTRHGLGPRYYCHHQSCRFSQFGGRSFGRPDHLNRHVTKVHNGL